jgi:hypothetical protein
VGRKNSSSTVPLKRSTKPLVRGEPTLVLCGVDVVERQVELVGMTLGAAELAPLSVRIVCTGRSSLA